MNKLQSMYRSGGLLKALLKDPEQRKMAEDMLGKAAKGMAVKEYRMGGEMKPLTTKLGAPAGFEPGAKNTYAGGGMMEYRLGGPVKERDLDKIQRGPRTSDEFRFEYVGEDYLQQRPEDIEDPGKVLKYFTVTEAARMLGDMDIDVRGMRPEQILKAAKVKGINPMSSARDLFDREMFKRQGGMSEEFEIDSDFRA